MINVNLISKKKRVTKGRNIFTIVLYSLFAIYTLYFLFQVIYVSVNLIVTNRKLNQVKQDSLELSSQILRDNEKLNNFVLSKFILTEINKLRREKFSYKEYLDQIVALLPSGNDVKTVDFETKGFVLVAVQSSNDASFRAFENNIRTVDLTDTHFESVFSNSVSRQKDGAYRSELLFKIKQNAGK